MSHVFMSASEDGTVKIWDRRSSQSVAYVSSFGGRAPCNSVSTSKNLIVVGTNEDLLIWDIHQLAKPLGNFTECHNDDITGIAFNSDGSQFISCSIDYVISMFNLS